MAELLRYEPDAQVELLDGNKGDLNVSVDGREVYRKGEETPEPEDVACEPPTALKPCPCCGSAMRIIEVFEAAEPARYRSTTMPAVSRIDTS